jgi:hypothetical protein
MLGGGLSYFEYQLPTTQGMVQATTILTVIQQFQFIIITVKVGGT